MEIQIITNKDQWDGWVFSHSKLNPFTQSWAWGDILIAEGKKVERLAVVENGETVAQAQIIYTSIFFGWQYAFCPKGPTIDLRFQNEDFRIYELFIKYLKKKKCIFFRIEPESVNLKSKILNLKSIDISPPATLLLDLNKPASELLAGMHAKTRYNINLAKKKNIRVVQEKTLDVFWKLMNKTGSRDKFGLHHKSHYAAVLASPEVFQLIAYQDKIPVACAVFVGFGNTFTYLYGASDYEYRNLMAPYLLQWEGMEIGNDFGSKWYDFFGVAPQTLNVQKAVISSTPFQGGVRSGLPSDSEASTPATPSNSLLERGRTADDAYEYDPKHQYAGVTRFKLGFGGVAHQDPGTFDIIVSQTKYRIYSFVRKLRRRF